MADPITPALDAREWAELLDPANKEWAPLVYHNKSAHAAAAQGLYGQPFGFTWDDVDYIRSGTEYGRMASGRYGEALADRIAALLPPREANG